MEREDSFVFLAHEAHALWNIRCKNQINPMLDHLLKSYLSLLTMHGLMYMLIGFPDVISLDEYASAVIAGYHSMGGINNRNVFSHSSGG